MLLAILPVATVLLAVPVTGTGLHASSGSHLGSEDAVEKNRPVSKVITLLKDMLKQLEKEATQDEEIYDKMACWCETNDREKTKSISDAESKIGRLTTQIEELTADSARLNTEIRNHEKEVGTNQDALDKATALRQKQLAEFNAEEKDLLESISAVKAAITVLSKHHDGSSLLQLSVGHAQQLARTMKHAMDKHAVLLQGVLSHTQQRVVASFIQAPADRFDASPTFKQSYAPQSGQIFGILKQMQDTFEANLASSQKEETSNQKEYEDLKGAKEAEITAGQQQIDTKTDELASTDQKNAESKQDVHDTTASLNADEQFLMTLKEKCQMTDKEWEERQKTRQLEMEAVSKALAVLSGDDAHDLFTRTFNPSLLQESQGSLDRRSHASQLLTTASERLHSPRLAALAYRVKLDAFTRVKKAIDDMVAQLLKEQEDEIKQKDFCVQEFHTNQLQTERKTREGQDLDAKIEDLQLNIKTLTESIDGLKAEISEMQVQMKRAGEDREKENKDFQMTVADQRQTQKLLQAALTVLGDFYGKKDSAAVLVQSRGPAGPPPPAGFQAYSKNSASGGVIDLLQQIISDAKSMEAEAIRSEEDAQKAYEDFVKETNGSIQAKSKEITNKSEERATSEADFVEAKEQKEAVVLELEQLSNSKAQLHQSCDFVMKNFEVRQTARDEEVAALKQAKAILSGANFDAFLQREA